MVTRKNGDEQDEEELFKKNVNRGWDMRKL